MPDDPAARFEGVCSDFIGIAVVVMLGVAEELQSAPSLASIDVYLVAVPDEAPPESLYAWTFLMYGVLAASPDSLVA